MSFGACRSAPPGRPVVGTAALAGGLMPGYGARPAYGCHIGAEFDGMVSGSLLGLLPVSAEFARFVLSMRLSGPLGFKVERVRQTGAKALRKTLQLSPSL